MEFNVYNQISFKVSSACNVHDYKFTLYLFSEYVRKEEKTKQKGPNTRVKEALFFIRYRFIDFYES